MVKNDDLKKLGLMESDDRAFLTLYLESPGSLGALEAKFNGLRRVLKDGRKKEERFFFEENVRLVKNYFKTNSFSSGSLCLIARGEDNFFLPLPLTGKVRDFVHVDFFPYLRPLAELEDAYETLLLGLITSEMAKFYLISLDKDFISGVIKGHVQKYLPEKSIWSEQRYERRRDKQLLLYTREVGKALAGLESGEKIERILLLGEKMILETITGALSEEVKEKTVCKPREDSLAHIVEILEGPAESQLWEKIRAHILKGGLGVAGLGPVYKAAMEGRVEAMVVRRGFGAEGRRCRHCGHLTPEDLDGCPSCGSASLFVVDVVNELVEMLREIGGKVDFIDGMDTLENAGNIGALLRY